MVFPVHIHQSLKKRSWQAAAPALPVRSRERIRVEAESDPVRFRQLKHIRWRAMIIGACPKCRDRPLPASGLPECRAGVGTVQTDLSEATCRLNQTCDSARRNSGKCGRDVRKVGPNLYN